MWATQHMSISYLPTLSLSIHHLSVYLFSIWLYVLHRREEPFASASLAPPGSLGPSRGGCPPPLLASSRLLGLFLVAACAAAAAASLRIQLLGLQRLAAVLRVCGRGHGAARRGERVALDANRAPLREQKSHRANRRPGG